jgi:hypothetical protein
MAQPLRIYWFFAFAATLLLPGTALAQSGTDTDDAFLSSNPATLRLNLNGQGIVLIVAGSSATGGSVQVGTTTTYIKFDLQSSLPPGTAASNLAKATLKLYLSSESHPSGSVTSFV